MKTLRVFLLFAHALTASIAYAFDPFVVEDIRVEGLGRIAAGTVFTYLPIKVGELIDDQRSAEALRALFKTGFFQDVRLQRDGKVLVVEVVERPAISDITITGNEDVQTEQVLDALKEIGLAQGRVFDRALLDKVEQELQRLYFSRGKYGVKIDTAVTPLERNRVNVAIAVNEGEVARIREIALIGNRDFESDELLDTFQLSSPTLFSFISGNDQYSKEKLAADLETLRSFYLDRGYINFNIDSTQVSITPDKKDIYITINLTEGERYTVNEIKLAGDLIVDAAELTPLMSLHKGDIFSRKLATESSTRISERLGNEGYAFASVNTIPDLQHAKKQVTLTFFVDPGKRVYVRRINFAGNVKTRDEVLRREMRQMEGAWFSTASVNRSRTRLQRLGFFDEVNVETPAVPGTADQVDIDYSVVERSSGSLTLGVGYSQAQGFLINSSVTQENVLGTGNRVSATFNNSDVNTIYSFSYNNPYYTLDGVSRGFSAFYRETDASDADVVNFSTDTFGGNVNYGIPVSEFSTVRASAGYENIAVEDVDTSSLEVNDFLTQNGDQFSTVKLAASHNYDTRNRAIFPDRGRLQTIGTEVSVPGLDLDFYKLNYRHLWYLPVTDNITLSVNGEVSYGDGYGDLDELPFFENYYAGGPRSVRGYQANSLGPRDSNGRPLGGNLLTLANIELIVPVPFLKEAGKSFRLSAFADAGNVFPDAEFEAGDLRYSAGVAALWLSPLGPLSFSLAAPINDQAGDDTQVFQFSIGVGL